MGILLTDGDGCLMDSPSLILQHTPCPLPWETTRIGGLFLEKAPHAMEMKYRRRPVPSEPSVINVIVAFILYLVMKLGPSVFGQSTVGATQTTRHTYFASTIRFLAWSMWSHTWVHLINLRAAWLRTHFMDQLKNRKRNRQLKKGLQ